MEDDFDGHYNEKQSEKDKKAKGGGSSKCKFFSQFIHEAKFV
jgi:hypothetical protein